MLNKQSNVSWHNGKVNDTRYDDSGNLMKQLLPKEKPRGPIPRRTIYY